MLVQDLEHCIRGVIGRWGLDLALPDSWPLNQRLGIKAKQMTK